MAKTLTRWLLITLVLSLGFGQLLRFEISGRGIYPHDLLAFLILLVQVRSLFKYYKDPIFVIPPGIKLILLGTGLGWLRALTLFPAAQLPEPFLYTVRIIMYLSAFLLLKRSQITIPRAVFGVAGITALLIGYGQYFAMPDMRWAQFLGWDDHLNRLTLPHFDPVFSGSLIVMSLLMFVTQVKKYLLIYIFTVPAVFLTYSRSVWLSLAVTGLLFIKNKLFLLAAGILMLMGIFFLPVRFGEGNNIFRTFSIEGRLLSDLGVAADLGGDLLIGRGLNTFALSKYSSGGFVDHSAGPNNSYLYILSTSGLLGLLGWLIFFRGIYSKSLFKPMLAFVFISALFNNVIFYPFILIWILLVESVKVPNGS